MSNPSCTDREGTANTVLGPVRADRLGIIAVHEALLSVMPGAQYGFDVEIDRAEVFHTLLRELSDFHTAGGGTVVDSTGMFHGRDLPLYEALSRASGVHIIASTGLGPEKMLGGYFLTPQTNPPTPWPAEKFADLFRREITEGMVIPRIERRAAAGLIATSATLDGMTTTDENLFRGAARAGLATGVPISIRYGTDPIADLSIILEEGLPADRVVVGGLDRASAITDGSPVAVARSGAFVALDHVGTEGGLYSTDIERAGLVAALVKEGHADCVLLSCSAIGVAKGAPGNDVPFSHVLSTFVPLLKSHGVSDGQVRQIVANNPRRLLAVR